MPQPRSRRRSGLRTLAPGAPHVPGGAPPAPATPSPQKQEQEQAREPVREPGQGAASACCAATRTRRAMESGDILILTLHQAHCPVWSAR